MKEVFIKHDKANVPDTKHAVAKDTYVGAKCLIRFVYFIKLSHKAFSYI